VIVPLVQVTAPPAAGAALRTAKLAAEPSEGGIAANAGVGKTPNIPAATKIARETIPQALRATRRSSLPAGLSKSAIFLQLAHRTRAPIPADVLGTRIPRIHAWIVDMRPSFVVMLKM
jgi:hypothetical protein